MLQFVLALWNRSLSTYAEATDSGADVTRVIKSIESQLGNADQPTRFSNSIMFKICTTTYQTFSSEQSAYLNALLTPARKPRQLRSSRSGVHFVSRFKTNVRTRTNVVDLSDKSYGNIIIY